MERVHDTVAWYQQKIGSYDKQLWEQSVEQKVLKGIQQAPRRSVRPKTDLIDVDLVRGSTFTKTKPQVPWTAITLKTISRVLLFPIHYKWWIQQTSKTFWLFLLALYCLQIFTTVVFFRSVGDSIAQDEQTLSAVMIPAVLMVLLGLIHSQTVLTHLSQKSNRDNKRDMLRRKRSLSQPRGSSCDLPAGASHTTLSSDRHSSPSHIPSNTSQYKSSWKENSGSRSSQGTSGPKSGRDRTKERKPRNKLSNNRTTLASKRTARSRNSQDSESAYISHEASDSIADRTSTEHDSNAYIESSKLDPLSPAETVRKYPYSSLKTDYGSPESDLSESHDEKALSHTEGQESSSDEEPIKSKLDRLSLTTHNTEHDVNVFTQTSVTLTVNGEVEECEERNNTGINDAEEVQLLVDENQRQHRSHVEVSAKEAVSNSDFIGLPGTSQAVEKEKDKMRIKRIEKFKSDRTSLSLTSYPNHNSEGSDSSFLEISYDKSSFKQTFDSEKQAQVVPVTANMRDVIPNHVSTGNPKTFDVVTQKYEAHSLVNSVSGSSHSVEFKPGNELVTSRQITPQCSRESSPTHTHSDSILQTKPGLRFKLTNASETDSENEVTGHQSLPNLRRRKVSGLDQGVGSESGTGRRALLNVYKERKVSTGMSSSGGETETTNQDYSRNTVSSEEWDDRIQSEVTSSSFSSATDAEISEAEDNDRSLDKDSPQPSTASNSLGGMAPSHVNIINILQPSSSQTNSHGPSDKVTCIIWEGNECKKVELTAMDIGWAIIDTVDKIPESVDYFLIGLTFSIIICFIPCVFQAYHTKDFPDILGWDVLPNLWNLICSNTWKQNLIIFNAVIQRLCLSAIFFFLHSVADRTYRQRLLYAKYFCYLTSSRRARKFDMPHFRLNKLRNIKTWLSLRSYLKKRGPQRSVDVIVSSSFLVTLIMLILVCLQLLRDAQIYLDYMCNWELLVWTLFVGVYLLRFMTLGLKINKKYRNLSVLITEQINLYLQMDQKPHKKEELMVANNVLKLAETLLKELESPFKISGISANPFVLNVTKVVVLSAFSAVLTELLGFKLKLYKIKLRA